MAVILHVFIFLIVRFPLNYLMVGGIEPPFQRLEGAKSTMDIPASHTIYQVGNPAEPIRL